MSLTLGARYDWYTDFGKSINPRAAVVWSTPWKSHLKLAYGRAFRSPTLYEVGLSMSNLKPETVQTVEAEYIQQVFDFAQAGVDVFYQKLDSLIDLDTNTFNFANFGHFTTKGIEFEVRTRDIHGARLLGSFTHLIRDTQYLGLTPKDYGAVAADYSWNRFAANVNTTIHGTANQMVADFFGRTPPQILEKKLHALLNIRLQAQIVKGVRAFATVNNVLDYRYQPEGLGGTYFMRGRTFLLGISAEALP